MTTICTLRAVASRLRVLALVATTIAFGAAPASATPAPNATITGDDITALVAANQLRVQSGQTCQTGKRAMKRSEIVGCIQTNGACAGGANATFYMPTWQDIINCRVLAGAVSTTVSGTADGPTPLRCSGPVGDRQCEPARAPQPVNALTSSTTTNPTGSFPISWSVTASSIVGSCTVTLLHGGTAVTAPVTLAASVASPGSYTGAAGAGVYTLQIDDSSSNGSCTVSGSLSWFQ